MNSPFRLARVDGAVIERALDNAQPGRTAYRVTAASFEAVQSAVYTLMNAANVDFSEFTIPRRAPSGSFVALGHTFGEERSGRGMAGLGPAWPCPAGKGSAQHD